VLTFIRFVLDHRGLVVAVLAALTALALWSISHGVVGSSMAKMFLADDPDYGTYLERTAVFGSHETMLVSYEGPDLLSVEALDQLEGLVRDLEGLEDMGRVQSLLDATRIAGSDGSVHIERYAGLARRSPERIPELQEELRTDPSAAGLLVSEDGRHGVVTLLLDPGKDQPAERGPALVAEILETFEAHGYPRDQLHCAGLLASVSELMAQTLHNLTRLFPLVAISVVGCVWLLFRRELPVLVAAGVSVLAVIWTMGFAIFLDPEVSIFMGLVPAVVMVVAISDTVHLWSAYALELGQGRPQREAIEVSGSEVGRACVLTSLTTLLGFLSICLVPAPAYVQLGLVLGFGSSVALLITVTAMPVVLSLVRAPEIRDPGTTPMAGLLASISHTATRHPWRVVAAFGLATVLLGYGASQVTIDADIVTRMDEDSTLRVDLRFFEENFAATNWMEVYVDLPEEVGFDDPELLGALHAYQGTLDADPGVDGVLSLTTVVADLNEALTGRSEVPEDPDALAQLLFLLEMGDEALLGQLVDDDRTTLRMMARLKTTALRTTSADVRSAQALADATLPEGVHAEALSLTGLYGDFMDEMVAGQHRGLLFAGSTIAVLMVIGLGSLRVGLWSMVPNLLPLLAVIGVASLTRPVVDSDTMIIMMMAIGIGVDDTIHFLMRFKLESRRAELGEAIRRTMDYAGRGIVLTSVILVVGFAPMALSDYFSIWLMGTYLPLALLVALAADVYLVPALATVGLLRYR